MSTFELIFFKPVTPAPNDICRDPGLYSIANPNNCSEYFICINQNSFIQFCPPDYLFSVEKQRCLPAAEVDCESRPFFE
ncbi:ORF-53 [Buzura suppressaria nucleopolyhedrovirus]|nr:ORF-53 [Buzura suppressaria nucleopolyhedrovirus]AHH82642.1 ORF-53 [Buzura suppressaria nucleopolyhedrovirus]